MTTEERILKAASEGVSVREIAAEHGLSEEGVTAALDRQAEAWFDGEHLRRELLFEVERLNALERHYYEKALPIDDVRKLLKEEIERCRNGDHLREAWALADRRLAAVEVKFFNRAMHGEGDLQAAIVYPAEPEKAPSSRPQGQGRGAGRHSPF